MSPDRRAAEHPADVPQRRYLSPREAASELHVSTTTVRRLIASGELVALRFSPRSIRIPLPALVAFQAGRQASRRVVIHRKRATELEITDAINRVVADVGASDPWR